MIKNAIAPMQAWLLSQGRCVACGRPLANAKKKKWKDGKKQVTCVCRRVFIYDEKKDSYRRALVKEVK